MKMSVTQAITELEARENHDPKAHELLVKLERCWNARNHDGITAVQNEIVLYVANNVKVPHITNI